MLFDQLLLDQLSGHAFKYKSGNTLVIGDTLRRAISPHINNAQPRFSRILNIDVLAEIPDDLLLEVK